MQTSNSNHDNRPSKRMRLGTKSCAECRKRKIRCNLAPNSRVCEYCIAHDVPCMPQQPKSSNQDTEADLKKKIEDLQGMVHQICKAIDLDIESANFADFEMGTMDALKRLKQVPTPDSSVGYSSSDQKFGSGQQENLIMSTEEPNSFENAPLLRLFKEAMFIESNDAGSDGDTSVLRPDYRIDSCIKLLHSIIPNENDLSLILGFTERYWFMWKGFDQDPNTKTAGGKVDMEALKRHILDSMSSDSPILIAKLVLDLALCMQQLPRTFEYQKTNLAASPESLVESFAGAVEILMLSESSVTLDGLDCCLLQFKLYINMGKPRKAWLCNQRAISLAMLLGLHHLEGRVDSRRKALWSQIWQVDRILSVSLGVPYTIQTSSVDISMRGETVEEQVMYDLGVLAGRVIERNQSGLTADYSVTQEIDQEFQRCINGTPPDWWKWEPDSTSPFNLVYGISAIKAQFFLVRKLLHLPYMLKSIDDNKYERSRKAALESGRELIKSFLAIRKNSGDADIICDLMDFQSFSAALTIIISLLSPKGPQDSNQEREDWELVKETTVHLKQVSKSMECHVASQAARLLDHLYAVRHGLYSNDDGYEAIVPHFGRVRINAVTKELPTVQAADDIQASSPYPFGAVEFSTNIFEHNFSSGFYDAELGVDWTSPFEVDVNFDWSLTYGTPLSWGQ